MQVASVRNCPQGGVLLPLLWNLTMDELLWDLNEAGYYSIVFADANSQAQSLKYYKMY